MGCAPRVRAPARSARAPARVSAPRGGRGGDGGDGDATRALPRPLPRLRGPPPGPWAAQPSGRAERGADPRCAPEASVSEVSGGAGRGGGYPARSAQGLRPAGARVEATGRR